MGLQVRVDDKVEKEIEKLGKIKHIVRIACGHGSDDPYYITKYRTRVGCTAAHSTSTGNPSLNLTFPATSYLYRFATPKT